MICLIAVTVFGVLSIITVVVLAGSGAPSKQREVNMQEAIDRFPPQAYACAKEKVVSMLKAPSTADFPWSSFVQDVEYVGLAESRYPQFRITSFVDAENSFGAMIRSNYSCDAYCDPVRDLCVCDCTIHD